MLVCRVLSTTVNRYAALVRLLSFVIEVLLTAHFKKLLLVEIFVREFAHLPADVPHDRLGCDHSLLALAVVHLLLLLQLLILIKIRHQVEVVFLNDKRRWSTFVG